MQYSNTDKNPLSGSCHIRHVEIAAKLANLTILLRSSEERKAAPTKMRIQFTVIAVVTEKTLKNAVVEQKVVPK